MSSALQNRARKYSVPINSTIICPNCWFRFPPQDILWIAAHPSLRGDPTLGPDSAIRFLPTRFNVLGNALDSKGANCDRTACPRCRLSVARACIENRPIFLSIAGTPSCGKSFLLASMSHQTRNTLPAKFKVSFQDADPACNLVLHGYEEQLFYSPEPSRPVRLKKTEEQGDDYVATKLDGNLVQLVSPFLFSVKPANGHLNESKSDTLSRVIAMYDNAGESFAPGRDAADNPVTRHLGQSMAVLFCYDPMQDARLRAKLVGKTNDLQATSQAVNARQETILYEVMQRIRKLRGMSQSESTERPLLLLVTKYDAWHSLLPDTDLRLVDPFVQRSDGQSAIDLRVVREVSRRTRDMLFGTSPDLVTAVESFSTNPWFIPVSATGAPPKMDEATGISGVRPCDLQPIWCDIPLLVAMSLAGIGLVPFVDSK
jgi:hypothetical protein